MNDCMFSRLECAQELLNDAVKNPESATAALNEAGNYLFGYVDYGEHLEGDHYTAEETIYNCLMIDVLRSGERVAVSLYDSLVMLWRELMYANGFDPKSHFTRFHFTSEMRARLNDPDFVAKDPEHYAMMRYLGTVGETFSEAQFLVECSQAFKSSDHGQGNE